MRQRALEADLVVVNHHLLCADLAVKDGSYGEVIPPYDTADPGRGPPDRGRGHPVLRRAQVSSHRVEDLCRDVERELTAAGSTPARCVAEVAALRHRAERFFRLLAHGAGTPPRRPTG